MKCFECGSKCITQYFHHDHVIRFNPMLGDAGLKVTHVNKACMNCSWQSFKTKLPEKIV
jgi:hypothetical protein